MMNYQIELEKIIKRMDEKDKRRLLLHSCCAPCSSYVLEYLSHYFAITVFYDNSNIFPESEYKRRVQEQQTFIRKIEGKYPIGFQEGNYNPDDFYESVKGFEREPEGGERCFRCYEFRLEETAHLAQRESYDYFTTTLSISPMKNAGKLNEIGMRLGAKYGVPYLPSDFKKKGGYQRSIELSRKYGLYRQNYCGCKFSMKSCNSIEVKTKSALLV